MKFKLPSFLIAASLFAITANAQDEDLGEAPSLDDAPARVSTVNRASETFRYRSYFLLEGLWIRRVRPSSVDVYIPSAELSGAATYDIKPTWQVFADAIGSYARETETARFRVNQVGSRFSPSSGWMLALGRERNRRSPGLVVSPSDFLHVAQSLPGQREERAGEWVARVSRQETHWSSDLIFVPFRRLTAEGFPNEGPQGYLMGRAHAQIHNLDFGASAGYLDDLWRAGASVQTFIASVWRVYAEGGYSSIPQWSTLLGGSYEGLDRVQLRTEIAYTSRLSSPAPLSSDWYAIVSLNVTEIANLFNLYATAIKSLSEAKTIGFFRGEWLLHTSHVVGASLVTDQEANLRGTADWKWSF